MAKIRSALRMARCIGCHSCMLACARMVYESLSPQKSAIQIRSRGGVMGRIASSPTRRNGSDRPAPPSSSLRQASMTWKTISRALRSVGIERSAEDLRAMGERIYRERVRLRERLGFRARLEDVPQRSFETPTPRGRLVPERVAGMLRIYRKRQASVLLLLLGTVAMSMLTTVSASKPEGAVLS